MSQGILNSSQRSIEDGSTTSTISSKSSFLYPKAASNPSGCACVCGWKKCDVYRRGFSEAMHPYWDGVVELTFVRGNAESVFLKQTIDESLRVSEQTASAWVEYTGEELLVYTIARHHFTMQHMQLYLRNPSRFSFFQPFSTRGARKYLSCVHEKLRIPIPCNDSSSASANEQNVFKPLYAQCPNVPKTVVELELERVKEHRLRINIVEERAKIVGDFAQIVNMCKELHNEYYQQHQPHATGDHANDMSSTKACRSKNFVGQVSTDSVDLCSLLKGPKDFVLVVKSRSSKNDKTTSHAEHAPSDEKIHVLTNSLLSWDTFCSNGVLTDEVFGRCDVDLWPDAAIEISHAQNRRIVQAKDSMDMSLCTPPRHIVPRRPSHRAAKAECSYEDQAFSTVIADVHDKTFQKVISNFSAGEEDVDSTESTTGIASSEDGDWDEVLSQEHDWHVVERLNNTSVL